MTDFLTRISEVHAFAQLPFAANLGSDQNFNFIVEANLP